uniref:Dolichol-phosphate mannosyltransferase subunit 3 n=3 Tax=Setaria TaxID=4554 RepID=K4AL56_SETIT
LVPPLVRVPRIPVSAIAQRTIPPDLADARLPKDPATGARRLEFRSCCRCPPPPARCCCPRCADRSGPGLIHPLWKAHHSQMKHIFKIVAILVAISSIWIALLETSTIPRSYTWLLPIYLVVALGCYGLFMVGFGLMFFPTCPQEAILLQQDIVEAKEFLAKKGVDVGSE